MSARGAVRGFLVLVSSSALMQVISFFTIAVAARRVGPDALGAYNFTTGLVLYLSLPINVGITSLALRDVAREPHRVREITGEVFALQAAIAIAMYCVLLVLTPVISPTQAAERLLPIAGIAILTGTNVEWALQGLERMGLVAAARVGGHLLYGALVPLLVTGGDDGIVLFAWLTVGGLALKEVLTMVFLVRVSSVPKWPRSAGRLWRRLKSSVPMSYAMIMIQIYGSIDLVMLGYLSTSNATGQYGVAYKIPAAIMTLGGAWVQVLLPRVTKLVDVDRRQVIADIGRFAAAVSLVAVPLAACAPFVATDMMKLFFGGQYAAAGVPFALLMVAVGITLLTGNYATTLLALRDDRRMAIAVTIPAVVNVVTNIFMIPAFGPTGAAIDTIVSELLVLVYVITRCRKLLGGSQTDLPRIARVIAATAVAVVALALLGPDVHVLFRILAGTAVFAVAAVVVRAVRPDELRAVAARRGRPAPVGAGVGP